MSIPVSITFTTPDPDVAPNTFAAAVLQLNSLIQGSIDETLNSFIMGVAVPNVDDQDKAWIRINTLGNPVGTYVFTQGVWVREEPTVSARFGLFTGDPTDWFDASGRGLKGAGPVALDYWGWALMNGSNGTQNWSNRFVIGGAMDNNGIVGFDDTWRTNVNGAPEGTGGVAEITLDADSTYSPGLTLGKHDADGEVDTNGPLYGAGGAGHDVTLIAVNTDPAPVSVVNPFVAAAYIQFIGYT